MARLTPRHLGSIIPEELAGMVDRERGLIDVLRPLFPDGLRTGDLQPSLRGKTLVMVCRTRALATEIRFQAREIRSTAEAAGFPVDEVLTRLTNQRPAVFDSPKEMPKRHIPDTGRERLAEAAETMDDPRLASALHRLANAPKE